MMSWAILARTLHNMNISHTQMKQEWWPTAAQILLADSCVWICNCSTSTHLISSLVTCIYIPFSFSQQSWPAGVDLLGLHKVRLIRKRWPGNWGLGRHTLKGRGKRWQDSRALGRMDVLIEPASMTGPLFLAPRGWQGLLDPTRRGLLQDPRRLLISSWRWTHREGHFRWRALSPRVGVLLGRGILLLRRMLLVAMGRGWKTAVAPRRGWKTVATGRCWMTVPLFVKCKPKMVPMRIFCITWWRGKSTRHGAVQQSFTQQGRLKRPMGKISLLPIRHN